MREAVLHLLHSRAFQNLVAVVIGGLIATVPVLIQSWRQERREAARLAAEAGLKDYESRVARGINSSPPIIFIWMYTKLMNLIAKGELTDADIRQALRDKDKLLQAYIDVAEERSKRVGE
jgi:hypothetical protein